MSFTIQLGSAYLQEVSNQQAEVRSLHIGNGQNRTPLCCVCTIQCARRSKSFVSLGSSAVLKTPELDVVIPYCAAAQESYHLRQEWVVHDGLSPLRALFSNEQTYT